MSPKKTPLKIETGTLPFEKFWRWLEAHPNCITRAGTADAQENSYRDARAT